jgi:hypothetical protein
VSPLATAQALEDVQTVAQFAQFAAALGGEAAVRAGLSVDKASPWIAERMGVPAALIPSDDERAALAQQAQQAQMLDMLAKSPVAAQVARNVTMPQPAAGQAQADGAAA